MTWFESRSRIIRSYSYVTTAGKRLQDLGIWSAPMASVLGEVFIVSSLTDLYVDLSVIYGNLSDYDVHLSGKYHHN